MITRVVSGFLLFALLLPRSAFAQRHSEPVDLPVGDEVVTLAGEIPFHPGDDLAWAEPVIDDSGWGTLPAPRLWHQDTTSRSADSGWYRVHLRASGVEGPVAVSLPPIYGAWQLWLDGKLIDGGTELESEPGVARERTRVVELREIYGSRGGHLLAIRVRAHQGLGGLGGRIRLGSKEELHRHVLRPMLATAGVLFVMGITMAWVTLLALGRRSGLPRVVVLATAGCIAVYGLANNEYWYAFFDATEFKIRLRLVAFLLAHAVGAFLVRELGLTRSWRPSALLAAPLFVLATAVAFVPLLAAWQVYEYAWLVILPVHVNTLRCAWSLPDRTPLVQAGVRAASMSLGIALLIDVVLGTQSYVGPSLYEAAFAPVAATLVGALLLSHGFVRDRAARAVMAAQDGIAIISPGGAVDQANPALSALLGRTGADLSARGLDPSFAPTDRATVAAALLRLGAAREPDPGERFEIDVLAPEGLRRVEVLGTRLDEGQILLSVRDLTERRRWEAEVARAQRLDSLGMLAGGIAHDFNNLLAGILVSASELLRQGDLVPTERRDRLEAIVESARRGGSLTQRLLQFARGRPARTPGIRPSETLGSSLDLLARTLGRNVEWEVDIDPDLPRVALDEGEIEQILLNLCVNARDAMAPKGGTITVRGSLRPDVPPRVAIAVADTGAGIPPEVMDHLFEPFVTTKDVGAGTGLGLSVIYGIVKSRGGEVEVETTQGQGTTVTALLPVVPDPPEAPRPSSAPAAVLEVQGTRVLLVDDEGALRGFLCSALQKRGAEVTALDGGEAAIRWLAEHVGDVAPIDVVVMDMMMPVVDGLEAAAALRARWRGLPVVVSSGYTGRESIEPLHASGPTTLLEKPYQVDDLVRAIRLVTAEVGAPF